MQLEKYKIYRNYIKWLYGWENKSNYDEWSAYPITVMNYKTGHWQDLRVGPLRGFECINCGSKKLSINNKTYFNNYFNKAFKKVFDENFKCTRCNANLFETFVKHPLIKVLLYEENIFETKRQQSEKYNDVLKNSITSKSRE